VISSFRFEFPSHTNAQTTRAGQSIIMLKIEFLSSALVGLEIQVWASPFSSESIGRDRFKFPSQTNAQTTRAGQIIIMLELAFITSALVGVETQVWASPFFVRVYRMVSSRDILPHIRIP
jgi:hypothetical protein